MVRYVVQAFLFNCLGEYFVGDTLISPLSRWSVVCFVKEVEILWWNDCVNVDDVVRSDRQSVAILEESSDIQDDPDFLPS